MSARASQRTLSPDFPASAQPEREATAGRWWLYLLECGDGSWYAGISNDLEARLRAHAEGRGARYTRGRGPFFLIASRAYPDRASASRAEWRLKQLPRARKRAFFKQAADASLLRRPRP
ncbi:GIY-YIG nuclease family protein [Luteimonas sp. SDU101]|uniref:GIY-YIG nuclease family protein n=1 Tax=unclassified Luteimonas TaxID=2629088 RepID=UPI003EBF942E